MKTLLLKAKPIPGKTTYRVPARHPFDVDKDGNLSTAPLTSGVQLEIGKETEVPCFDARHEQLLRDDEHLAVVDEKGKHEKAAAMPELPAGVSPELAKRIGEKVAQLETDLEDANEYLKALEDDKVKLLGELSALQAKSDAQGSAIAELEAKLKAATTAPPAADTKPPEVKPVDVKAEKADAKPTKK